jgi:hypothetical protein
MIKNDNKICICQLVGVFKISKVLIVSVLKFRLQKTQLFFTRRDKKNHFSFFIGVVDMRGSPPSPHLGIRMGFKKGLSVSLFFSFSFRSSSLFLCSSFLASSSLLSSSICSSS